MGKLPEVGVKMAIAYVQVQGILQLGKREPQNAP